MYVLKKVMMVAVALLREPPASIHMPVQFQVCFKASLARAGMFLYLLSFTFLFILVRKILKGLNRKKNNNCIEK